MALDCGTTSFGEALPVVWIPVETHGAFCQSINVMSNF
jgi:hypothetical protein